MIPTPSTTTDVVFTFSVEMLEDTLEREFCRPPDQTLLALANDERVGRLLVADPWRSHVLSVARRRPRRLVEEVPIASRTVFRVRPHRFRRRDSTKPRSLARSYRTYGERLGKALAGVRGESTPSPRSAALVTYSPFVAAYCESPWIRNVVYFGQDDWATGEGFMPWWEAFHDAYARIDRRGASIFVVSEEIARRISPRAQVVPNGISPEIWRPRHPPPARIEALPRPRAIYSGSIDDRLLQPLVELTADTVGSVIVIGLFVDPETKAWLRTIRNVHLFDTVGQVELAATVQACDLGIIPHRDQAGIRAMSPLKLYEYLAGGLAVVSVDLPPIRGVADDRVVITQPETWAQGLREALSKPPAPEPERLQFIEDVAWARRMAPVVDAAVGGSDG